MIYHILEYQAISNCRVTMDVNVLKIKGVN